jgi:ABC-type antimicrobial peptide transport system permease subunit
MGLVIHAEREAGALSESVRELIREIGPSVPLGEFRTMAEIRSDETTDREFPAILLGIFSGIALILAVVGVYGVVASAAKRRTFEMGIRMAVGATPAQIRRLVVGHALLMVSAGLAIGLGGAMLTTSSLRSLLFNVRPLDLGTLVAVPAVIAAAALVASFLPAFRASQVEPSDVLRSE